MIDIVDVAVPPAGKFTLDGLNETVRPAGEAASVRVIVPVNPLKLVRVIVDAPKLPR